MQRWCRFKCFLKKGQFWFSFLQFFDHKNFFLERFCLDRKIVNTYWPETLKSVQGLKSYMPSNSCVCSNMRTLSRHVSFEPLKLFLSLWSINIHNFNSNQIRSGKNKKKVIKVKVTNRIFYKKKKLLNIEIDIKSTNIGLKHYCLGT